MLTSHYCDRKHKKNRGPCLLPARQQVGSVVIPMAATAVGGHASVVYRRASTPVCFIKINIPLGIFPCRTSPALSFPRRACPRPDRGREPRFSQREEPKDRGRRTGHELWACKSSIINRKLSIQRAPSGTKEHLPWESPGGRSCHPAFRRTAAFDALRVPVLVPKPNSQE